MQFGFAPSRAKGIGPLCSGKLKMSLELPAYQCGESLCGRFGSLCLSSVEDRMRRMGLNSAANTLERLTQMENFVVGK